MKKTKKQLESEVLKLKQDIFILVDYSNPKNPSDAMKYMETFNSWKIVIDLEKQIWSGSHLK
jgi:hypothetical protein